MTGLLSRGAALVPEAMKRNLDRIWAVLVILYVGSGWLLLRGRPTWGDENHFVESVRFFAATPWSSAIADYPEVTPPLFYMLYAAWGRVFGLELDAMRALSALIGVVTLLVFYRFISRHVSGRVLAFGFCALFLVNPYVPGIAVLVFTDMPALLCVLLAFHWFGNGRHAAAAVAVAAALLFRQYSLVFWLTLVVAAAWGVLHSVPNSGHRKERIRGLLMLAAAPLPLLALLIVWGDLVPPSGRERWIVEDGGMSWNPHALTAYVAFLALYLAPFAVLLANRFRGRGRLWLAALPLGIALQALVPVRTTRTAIKQAGMETIGLLHRVLRSVAGNGWVEHVILTAACSAGVWLLLAFLRDDLRLWRRGELPAASVLSLALYLYLAIMPLSYQIWEKYLLLVLPLVIARLALLPVRATPGRSSASVAKSPETRAVPVV